VGLARAFVAEWRQGLILVKPETVVRWSRQRFRTYWARKSRRRAGRPAIDPDIRALIRKISRANPLHRAERPVHHPQVNDVAVDSHSLTALQVTEMEVVGMGATIPFTYDCVLNP
jgi:hypothetical protein